MAKKEKVYTIDQEVLNVYLHETHADNWLVENGIQQIKSGKKLGQNMINFLEHINILNH